MSDLNRADNLPHPHKPTMNSPDLVQEIGQRLNLTGLTLKDGICRLVFDDQLPIDIEDDGSGNLCFHTNLGPAPFAGREDLFAALLSAHLFGLETGGAVFGLHPKTHEIFLFRSLPLEALQVDAALAALENFTQQAETWKGQLTTLQRESSDSGEASSDPVPPAGIRA